MRLLPAPPSGPLLLAAFLSISCANPINQVTAARYSDTCAVAEGNDRLEMAEIACERALTNVDWGNLGPDVRSQKLYNLARIKRRLGKFAEAERFFTESIAIEQTLSPATDPKMGRRYVELALTFAEQNRWIEGGEALEKALPAVPHLTGADRSAIAIILPGFAKELRTVGKTDLAASFEAQAAALK